MFGTITEGATNAENKVFSQGERTPIHKSGKNAHEKENKGKELPMAMIYQSQFPAFSTPQNLSISQFLVRTNPDDVPADKTVICDFENPDHSLTYGELRTRSAQGAATLRNRHDMKEGNVVCLFGLNSVNWMLLCHCVLWGGGCFAGINPLATPYELVHYFGIARPSIIAVDAALLPKVQQALRDAPPAGIMPRIIVIEDGFHNQVPSLPKVIVVHWSFWRARGYRRSSSDPFADPSSSSSSSLETLYASSTSPLPPTISPVETTARSWPACASAPALLASPRASCYRTTRSSPSC